MSSRCSAARVQPRWTQSLSADLSLASAKPVLAARCGGSYLDHMSEVQISLTESAARRVAWIAARQHKPAILRLAVDGGGCAGFTYKFELADAVDDGDEVTATDGVTLVVDPVSLDLVRGSAVDFVED